MKLERLLRRIRQGHLSNIRFTDFCKLVEAFGFEVERVRGSHFDYVHPLVPRVLPLQERQGEAKPYQVREFLGLVDEYDLEPEA